MDGARHTLVQLLDHGRDDLGVAVTLITGAEHADEVEIFFAIDVLEYVAQPRQVLERGKRR